MAIFDDIYSAAFNLTGRPQRRSGADAPRTAEAFVNIALAARHETLDLRGLGLSALPPSIADCTWLTSLNLGDNELIEIPPEVFALPYLRRLYVHNNRIRKIPSGIDRLTQLDSLYAHSNQIAHVSDAIGRLPVLQVLNLAYNKLTSFPESLCRQQRLRALFLQGNRIEVLPDEIGLLATLEELHLDQNALVELPSTLDGLQSLEILNLANNNISALPGSTARLSALQHAFIEGNPLERRFQHLPGNRGLPGVPESRKIAQRLKGVRLPARDYDAPTIPPPKPGPIFTVDDTLIITLVAPSPSAELADLGELLTSLQTALGDLSDRSSGSNAYQALWKVAADYNSYLGSGTVNVDGIYGRGMRLINAYHRTQVEIAREQEIPEIPAGIAEACDSAIVLHGVVIASTVRGRHLIELAHHFDVRKIDRDALKTTLIACADAIGKQGQLFSSEVRTLTADMAHAVAAGPFPERSTDEAVRTYFNLTTTIGRALIAGFSGAAVLIASEAVVASQPGAMAINQGKIWIDALWQFTWAHEALFGQLAFLCGMDFAWLTALLSWMRRREAAGEQ